MSLKKAKTRIQKKLQKPEWREVDFPNERAQAEGLWSGVEADTGHPLLMHFLARLIEVGNVPARDDGKLARAIQLYSARKIKFFRERPERFQTAMRTIAWGIGDCDDKARFIAASLRSFRIPVKLRFLYFSVPLPTGLKRRVGHVYPVAFLDDKWIPLESVREYPWGYDPAEKPKRKGYKVEIFDVGDSADSPRIFANSKI